MNNLPRDLVLRHEEIPDDEALLDELIALVEQAIHAQPRASPHKNLRKIISAIVFYGLLLSLIVGAFFLSQGEKKPILGYSFMNVLTWSMEPEIPQGSLVIIKETDPAAIQIGDDITYTIDPQTSVTHRVIGIMEDYENSGERGFETQGIDNDAPDFEIVPAINVVGVVKFHVPVLGGWLTWLSENLWLVLGFALGIMLFIFLLKGALRKPQKPRNTQVYTDPKGGVRVNKTTHSERESNHMKGKFRRIFYSAGAMVVAVSLAVGGTFAYRSFQHKSNDLKAGWANKIAHLVENYDKEDDWRVKETLAKEISVKNMGGTKQFPGDNWGDIYVRIKLKEFLSIAPITYEYYIGEDDEKTDQYNKYVRFMIDKNGEFVRFAPGSSLEDITKSNVWKSVISDSIARKAFLATLSLDDFIETASYKDEEAGQTWLYLPTKENDPNGQYGAHLPTEITVGTGVPLSDKPLAVNKTHHTSGKYEENDECKYDTHIWQLGNAKKCDDTSINYVGDETYHDYVEWTLGSAVDYIGVWNGQATAKWILDTETGWAYWGEPLIPKASTSFLLEKVKLIKQPNGAFTYVIHVDMEARDLEEFWDKDDVPPDIWDCFHPEAKDDLAFSPSRVEVGLEDGEQNPSTLNRPASGADRILYEVTAGDSVTVANIPR